MHSRETLARDFRKLGVEPGDTIMLHASIRAVGEVAGGPDYIHLALSDALTADGTLMMYASCPQYYDEVGRGHLSPEQERDLLESLPPFDALTARCARDNGALVELFRTWPGTRVNHHVARFAVRGGDAAFLLSEQPWDDAFGHGSALERLVALDGRILLLGSDHDAVTFLHYAEHIVDITDKIVVHFKVPVLEQGRRVWKDMREIDTGDVAHAHWPDRFFARIVDTYLNRTGNDGGLVGAARSHLIDARGLLAFALDVMQRVAAEASAADRLLMPDAGAGSAQATR
jgi:aminoglycoside 3-N-acetyltransferase